MEKLLTLIAAIAVTATFAAPQAKAQAAFMPMVGYDMALANGSLFVGVGAEFGLLPGFLPIGLGIRPSAEFYFISGVDAFQLNAEAIAQLTAIPNIGIYGGAGLGFLFWNPDGVDGTSHPGLNLLAGAQFGTGFLVPFAQVRLKTARETRFQLMGGVRLGL